VFCLALAACGNIAATVPIVNRPETWEEACIQKELVCLNDSHEGRVVVPILAPIVVLSSETSGEMIVRSCKLQGDLCRSRSPEHRQAASRQIDE
jgi:hypothetical protein